MWQCVSVGVISVACVLSYLSNLASADVHNLQTAKFCILCTHGVEQSAICPVHRVCTDPGKVWKVLEFNVEIFKALKSLENDHGYGKVWKNP